MWWLGKRILQRGLNVACTAQLVTRHTQLSSLCASTQGQSWINHGGLQKYFTQQSIHQRTINNTTLISPAQNEETKAPFALK